MWGLNLLSHLELLSRNMSQAKATLTTEQKSLLKNFKSSIAWLSNVEVEDTLCEFERAYPTASENLIMEYKEIGSIVAKRSQVLSKFEKQISSADDWESYASKVVRIVTGLKNKTSADAQAELDVLDYLKMLLNEFVTKLSIRKFSNLPLDGDEKTEATDALDHFIETGKVIATDADYKGSHVEKLDRILLDMKKEPNTDLAPLRCGNNLNTDDSFVAIAAPSMEGKTQAAFTFKHVKPIYFPLCEAIDDNESSTSQPIYINFRSHVNELRECAELDLKLVSPKSIKEDNSNYTATKLKKHRRNMEFWTVGFLMGLVSSEVTNADWIKHYAEKRDFDFEPVSIANVPKGYFDGYCLFLDEFVWDSWTVFIRNLARAIGLRCICSNTNTRVANIVGKTSASAVGTTKLWSLVAVRLNPPCELLLNRKFELSSSIQAIREAAAVDSSLFKFLADFENHQLKYLRPGVAIFVAKAFAYFVESLREGRVQANFGCFLQTICFQLSCDLSSRKSHLTESELAYYARICLFYPQSYSNNNENSKSRRFFNQQAFLEYHLSYLKNPQDQNTWIFATVPPKYNLLFTKRLIRTVEGLRNYTTWDEEYSFFEKEEVLTNMGCMFIPFVCTPTALLSKAQLKILRSSARAASDAENLKALTLPGNSLEVSAAVSIADASQHSFIYEPINFLGQTSEETALIQKRSFAGQPGLDFLKNLILNLDPTVEFQFNAKNSINFDIRDDPAYNLEHDFLKKCRIPFIYGIGHEIENFKKWSVPESDFYVGSYERPENKEQIDGKFKFLFEGREVLAVVECKHYSVTLRAGKLLEILEKAVLKNISILNFIFCQQCPNNPKSDSKLYTYCDTNKVNLYRVRRLANDKFVVEPYFSGSKAIFKEPNRICIIFESLRIQFAQIPPKTSVWTKIKDTIRRSTSSSEISTPEHEKESD